jgi:hypothetical protein
MKPSSARPTQFSIAALLLAMTSAGLSLAIARWSPPWGIAVALVLTVSLVRTTIVLPRGPERKALPLSEKLELFGESVAVSLFCLLAALLGFLCGVPGLAAGQVVMDVLPMPVAIAAGVLLAAAPPIALFTLAFWKLTFPFRR